MLSGGSTVLMSGRDYRLGFPGKFLGFGGISQSNQRYLNLLSTQTDQTRRKRLSSIPTSPPLPPSAFRPSYPSVFCYSTSLMPSYLIPSNRFNVWYWLCGNEYAQFSEWEHHLCQKLVLSEHSRERFSTCCVGKTCWNPIMNMSKSKF